MHQLYLTDPVVKIRAVAASSPADTESRYKYKGVEEQQLRSHPNFTPRGQLRSRGCVESYSMCNRLKVRLQFVEQTELLGHNAELATRKAGDVPAGMEEEPAAAPRIITRRG